MKKYYFLLLPLFLYLLGISNIDGLRQGTETFYLKIAREMSDQVSLLTPLHQGSPHWSKPPFVFWLSMPFYWILPFEHHTNSRLSIILFTLLTTLLISKEVHRNTKNSVIFIFLVLISSFGFFRYGKIYMMDIPLATLSTLSILYFYNSQRHQKKNLLFYSILTLSFSILVKGPISLIMIGASLFFYGLLNKENREKKMLFNGFIYLISGSLVASIWFVLCYLEHGYEFINYFFLRENLGKFESQVYPARKIIQGLLLYGLPWSLILFSIFFKLKNLNLITIKSFLNKKFESFIFVSFLTFFLIWFLPSQRSHHYAIPSLPLFLILIIPVLNNTYAKLISRVNTVFFLIFGTIGFIIGLRFLNDFDLIPIIISLLVVGLALYSYKLEKEITKQGFLFLAGLSLIWSILIPQFSLSKLPTKYAKLINSKEIATVFKKNYYFEQILGTKIRSLHAHEVASFSKSNNSFFILTESFYNQIRLNGSFEKLGTWPVWKRKVNWPSIKKSLINKDLSILQENYVLLKSTPMD